MPIFNLFTFYLESLLLFVRFALRLKGKKNNSQISTNVDLVDEKSFSSGSIIHHNLAEV